MRKIRSDLPLYSSFYSPFFTGVFPYEATQRQLETAIRKTKREILTAENLGDKDLMLAKSIKLKTQTAAYSDFSKVAKLKQQKERIGAQGFNRKVSGTSRSLAIKHHKDWLKSIEAEDTSLNTLEKYYQAKYNNTKEYQELMLRKRELGGALKNIDSKRLKEECISLYDFAETRNTIASKHFLERFADRRYKKDGSPNYSLEDIKSVIVQKPSYSDGRNGRLIIRENGVSVVIEGNKIVTLVKGRVSKHWKKI